MLHINLEKGLDLKSIERALERNNIRIISLIKTAPNIEDVFACLVKE